MGHPPRQSQRMSGIRDRLAKGAAWTMLSRILVNLISLLSTFLLAHLLTPEDFGLVAIATTLLEVFNAATGLSLANALIRHNDPSEDHFHSAWTLNFLRALLVGGIFAAAAWPVAHAYGDPRLVDIMLLFAVSILLTGFGNPKMVIFSRDLVFSQDVVLQVSQKLAGLVVSVTLALIFRSYWALVLGVIAAQVTAIVISYIFKPYRPRLNLGHWRELLSFSVWMTLQDFLYTMNWATDHLMIGAVVGRAGLGHFSVGSNLAAVPMREAGLSITKLLFPGLVRVMHDRERIQAAYLAAQALLVAIILPVGLGMALCARPAVELAMGAKWLPAVPVIQGLSIIMALQALGMLAKPLAMAKGLTRGLFNRNLTSFLIGIPLSICGLLLAGLNGVVIARVVAGLISMALNLELVRQLIGLPLLRQITSSGRSLVSCIVMAAGVLAWQRYGGETRPLEQLAETIALGGILYVATHYLLWLRAGKGDGPELEIANMTGKLLAVIKSRRAML